MLVRSMRDEIINLDRVVEYTFDDPVLIVRDGDKHKKFTLTEESARSLSDYLNNKVR